MVIGSFHLSYTIANYKSREALSFTTFMRCECPSFALDRAIDEFVLYGLSVEAITGVRTGFS